MRTTALLAIGAVALSAAGAPAQYYPARPGFPGGGLFTTGFSTGNPYYSNNPYAGGLNSYNFGYNYSFGLNYVNPITGGRTVFQVNRSYNSPAPFGTASVPNPLLNSLGYLVPRQRAGYVNPYLSSGMAGYASPGVNPIAVEQARLARVGANANRFDKPAAPAPARQPARDPKPAPAPLEVPKADPEAIHSGEAINALIPKINSRLDAGNKVESPLIPSELLRSLQYTPGPAPDLLALLRDGPPTAPEAFGDPALSSLKGELDKLAEPVAKSVLAGKPTLTDESKKLAARVKSARPEVEKATKSARAPERAATLNYLDGLAALAQVDSTPALRGVYDPTFAAVGGSATDYARYAQKHELKLAPAPAASVTAYDALYRALATTLAGLDREAAR